ncbi:DUF4097 domain-containing protein [Glycomyces sp. A-F 0318]|uniref:DUF4097 family beta strand repeat-containing protein n=1 Tax=Glycomyces amatae TaxID=2881355 RepID=UPI001E54CD1B|nr:DUF4097 family beta strand repeat-containing protein [Glycomyces amatae]MCD0442508.1 DUF4097 domain-containing protein [Glycomyces amatae]
MRIAAPITAAMGLVLAAALSGCSSETDATTWDLGSFSGDLTIELAGADLEIRETGSGDAITVTRHVTSGREAEADPALDGGTLDLTAGCDSGLFGDCTIAYEVTVPAGSPVTVEGDSGSVTAVALTAATSIGTDNGAITVEDAAGPLDLRTDNGSITVDDASSKNVAAAASSGAVDLAFSDIPDLVSVTTENGAVTVTAPAAGYRVTAATDNGSIDNELTEDDASPHHIEVTTENGAIALRNA